MKIKKKNQIIDLFNIVLFIINPFIATVTSLLLSILIKSKHSIKILVINISLFFGLLNATKLIEGDLIAYQNFFVMGSQKTLIDFLSQFPTDYVFYIATYFSYYILFHSWELYIILITFFSYLLIFKSAEIIMSKVKGIKSIDIILGIIIIAMFYPLFSLSAHLVRNFVAAAIIFYFSVNYFFNNKNLWSFLIIAISIHVSALMFVINYFIPKSVSFKNILRLFLTIMLYIFVIFLFLELIDYNFFENLYVYTRLEKSLAYINIFSFQNVFIFLLVLFIIIVFNQNYKENNLTKEFSRYLLFLFSIIVLGYALSYNPVIQGRILLYNYFLLIPLFLIIFIRRGIFFRIVNIIILTIFTVFFIKNLLYGTWTYIDGSEIITSNIFDYFNTRSGV